MVMGPLAMERTGSGEPVVMLHGLGGTLNVWEPQVRLLKDRFLLLRFDLRGSGRSRADGPVSVDGWVDDLADLMDQEDIAAARLVGHSLGTLVAQHFAARHPERVERMVLLGVNRAPPEARRASLRERANEVRANGMSAIADGALASATAKRTQHDNPAVLAAVREMMMGQDPRGYAWTCDAIAGSTRPDLSGVKAPLLLVAGADDTVSPPKISEELAQETGASLVIVPDCGHWLPLEQAARVSTALMDFL